MCKNYFWARFKKNAYSGSMQRCLLHLNGIRRRIIHLCISDYPMLMIAARLSPVCILFRTIYKYFFFVKYVCMHVIIDGVDCITFFFIPTACYHEHCDEAVVT